MDHFSILLIFFLLLISLKGTNIEFLNRPIIQTFTNCNNSDSFPLEGCFNYHQEYFASQINENCLFFMQNSNPFCFEQEYELDQFIIDSLFQSKQENSTQSLLIFSYQIPLSICGDNLVSGEEECEDGNHFPFDGCFNCKYQCEQLCLVCIKGYCIQKDTSVYFVETFNEQNISKNNIEVSKISHLLEDDEISYIFRCRMSIDKICILCNDGYYLNEITNLCETNCGDYIIQGQEECDDGNQDNHDGCSQCKLVKYDQCNQEGENFCSVCHYGQCLKCMDGYLLQDSACFSQCGDGLVNTNKLEECDNPNEKGCINCQIVPAYLCYGPTFSICLTCDQHCEQCSNINNNLICEKCQVGYYPIGKNCELCDSNCITCQNSSFLCTSCYRNDCDFCESYQGLYTDTEIKACVSICGDGILVNESEQCDDGNQEDEDGCDSTCHLEGQTIDYSSLQNIKYSGLHSIDFLMGNEEQKFSLDCQTVVINIDSYDSKQFEFISTDQNGNCRIQFTFYQSIYKYNKIHVRFTFYESKSRLLLMISENTIQFDIEPEEFIIKSENQLNQADTISSAQQSFGLIFLILIPISIITNLFDYLWAILEILSWINNFYFLNVRYPFNVEIFLLNSDWTSIFNFPTYQELNQPDCDYYFKAPERFETKGINPLFFNNAQIPFMFIFSSISIYLIIKYLFILLQFIQQNLRIKTNIREKHFSIFNLEGKKYYEKNKTQQNKQQVDIKDHKLFDSLIILLNSVQKELKKKIKQTISLCLLDITLAIMLQLIYAEHLDDFIVGINQLFALLSISLIIFHLHQSYQTINIHKQLAENQYFKERYEIYYENVNTNSAFGSKYKFFGLLRKIFYIFFMIFYYNEPLLQTLLCFITSNFGLALIIYENPYKTKAQFTLQFISDFSLSSIILIIVLFAFNDQRQVYFIENNKVIFGWIIIALVVLALFVEISVLFYQLTLSLYSIFKLLRGFVMNFIKKQKFNPQEIKNEIQVEKKQSESQQKNELFIFQIQSKVQQKITSQMNQTIQVTLNK
ncbi:unnamed protein product [Paramecium pentaurelia]|uniref:Insulin-like growth factor binding protein, N-terminal n=1 Tax=Paramecium pentaurelia TaxID=43138 RepID=A0A8S1X3D5_9CILI|nr:unnamed protein product [Paramecium pentaurelia]